MKHMAERVNRKNNSLQIRISEILLLYLLIFLLSCHKDNIVNETDPQYPTTLKPLGSQEYQNMLAAYWLRNPFMLSDLNPYGFADEHSEFRDIPYPPIFRKISSTEAISIAKKFIAANLKETGVSDTSLLVFSVGNQFSVGDSYFVTYLQTQTQVADSMDIQYAQIGIRIENDQVVECFNNWFPKVYIPLRFLISPKMAVSNLAGQEYYIPTMTGGNTGKVTLSDLTGAIISKEIIQYYGTFPAKDSSGNLELRIVYKIFLPAIYTIFYVDVMEGKTLGSEPTIYTK
jgi:hypothetical protein